MILGQVCIRLYGAKRGIPSQIVSWHFIDGSKRVLEALNQAPRGGSVAMPISPGLDGLAFASGS